MIQKIILISLFTSSLALSGCAGALLGGAAVAGGAAFATLHDRRTPGTVVDDRNLSILISNKLSQDKIIKANSHTNITVYNGVVLVTGEATNQDIVHSIVKIIKPLPKVRRVDASLAIGLPSSLLSRTKDSALTAKVKAAVATLQLPKFDPTLLKVTTERGNVYLMGLVTRTEGHAIIDSTRRVGGVVSVTPLFEYLDNVAD